VFHLLAKHRRKPWAVCSGYYAGDSIPRKGPSAQAWVFGVPGAGLNLRLGHHMQHKKPGFLIAEGFAESDGIQCIISTAGLSFRATVGSEGISPYREEGIATLRPGSLVPGPRAMTVVEKRCPAPRLGRIMPRAL